MGNATPHDSSAPRCLWPGCVTPRPLFVLWMLWCWSQASAAMVGGGHGRAAMTAYENTHTHTHTHIYVCVCVYIYTHISGRTWDRSTWSMAAMRRPAGSCQK